jgi:hypothetical protein
MNWLARANLQFSFFDFHFAIPSFILQFPLSNLRSGPRLPDYFTRSMRLRIIWLTIAGRRFSGAWPIAWAGSESGDDRRTRKRRYEHGPIVIGDPAGVQRGDGEVRCYR